VTVAKKKKAAKSKTAKKVAKKKAPKGPGRYTADLKSIRDAIDKVRKHLDAGQKYVEKRKAAGGAGSERAAQLLLKLGEAHAIVAAECCQADLNCDF
jgi:hypothetical protein